MSNSRPQPTLIDYMAIAISPALIIVLVGSLAFFLLMVFYAGQYEGRLYWTTGCFVFAAVLISRVLDRRRGRTSERLRLGARNCGGACDDEIHRSSMVGLAGAGNYLVVREPPGVELHAGRRRRRFVRRRTLGGGRLRRGAVGRCHTRPGRGADASAPPRRASAVVRRRFRYRHRLRRRNLGQSAPTRGGNAAPAVKRPQV